MLASSSTISPTGRSDATLRLGDATVPVVVRRSARARSIRLSVDPRSGALRLTLPQRAALAPALAWAATQGEWIATALDRVAPSTPLRDGAVVPVEDTPRTIMWSADGPRAVRLAGDRLLVGGPAELVGPRVLRWLRAEAKRRLAADTQRIATRHGIVVGRIRVGDARTRWGSCSSGGDIAYSWRLLMAPAAVREATVAHELAHRLHMDHSPAFHAAVHRLLGRDPAPERAWLRANGAALHRIGGG